MLKKLYMLADLSRVNDQSDVTVHVGGKLAEEADDLILFVESLGRSEWIRPHHELKVVYHYVRDVVNIDCMRHGLKPREGGVFKIGLT